MTDLQFTTDVFYEFRASLQFHLGKIQHDVGKNTLVQFDGTTMKLGGVAHSYPELRAAIKAGWLVPSGSNVGDFIPTSANVKVRAAIDTAKGRGKQVSTEVQHDETYVSPARKAATTDGVKIESKAFNATLVRDTEGDGRSVGSAIKKASAVPVGGDAHEGETVATIKTASKRTFSVDGSTSMNADEGPSTDITGVVEHIKGVTPRVVTRDDGNREGQSSESGKIIANVKTAAKRKVVLSDANSADAEISKLDNATRTALAPKGKHDIAAMAGDTLEDILAVNEPENRGKVLAAQAKAKRLAALKVTEIEAVAPEEGDLPDPKDSPIPVLVIDAVSPAKVVVARSPKSVEDFAVNGDDLELAPGIRWNKKIHWKSRVKMALQYKDNPTVLNLIRGYEVPSVVKGIDDALSG